MQWITTFLLFIFCRDCTNRVVIVMDPKSACLKLNSLFSFFCLICNCLVNEKKTRAKTDERKKHPGGAAKREFLTVWRKASEMPAKKSFYQQKDHKLRKWMQKERAHSQPRPAHFEVELNPSWNSAENSFKTKRRGKWRYMQEILNLKGSFDFFFWHLSYAPKCDFEIRWNYEPCFSFEHYID